MVGIDRICICKTKFNSLIIALFMSLTCWATVIGSVVSIPYISIVLSIFIVCFVLLFNRNIIFDHSILLRYLVILLLLAASFILNNNQHTIKYLAHYIVFGSTAFILTNIKYDSKLIIRYSVYVYALYLFFFLFLVFPQAAYYDKYEYGSTQMGWAYSFVPGVLWGLCMFFYKDFLLQNKKDLIIAIISLIGSCYVILFCTVTRGAILSVLSGIFFIALSRVPLKYRKIYLLLFIIIIICVGYYAYEVLNSSAMSNVNNIGALQKMIALSNSGDISNGRLEFYRGAIDIIRNYPILGRGVGYFEGIYGIYTHQLFLQLLCEMGIIGLILFTIPLYKLVAYFFSSVTTPDSILLIVLFSVTIVNLLFSSTYWLLPNFWFLYFSNYHCNHLSDAKY